MKTATKKAKPVILPKKPSALIRIALEDLAKAERSKKCEINMMDWHYTNGATCTVCLAGAVMRSSLGVPDTVDKWPDDCGRNENQLFAINDLRTGDVADAFEQLGKPFSEGIRFERDITPYEKDRTAFKRDMRKLAADLEAAGY